MAELAHQASRARSVTLSTDLRRRTDLQVVGEWFCESAPGLGGILVDRSLDVAGVRVYELDDMAPVWGRRIRPHLVNEVGAFGPIPSRRAIASASSSIARSGLSSSSSDMYRSLTEGPTGNRHSQSWCR